MYLQAYWNLFFGFIVKIFNFQVFVRCLYLNDISKYIEYKQLQESALPLRLHTYGLSDITNNIELICINGLFTF